MAAKDRTWQQTKSLIGTSTPLKLFKEWFESTVFTKAKVDPNSFFGINDKPTKGATFAKAHGLYISSKGPSKAPNFKSVITAITTIKGTRAYTNGYLDLASKKEHTMLTIDKVKDSKQKNWLEFSIWDGLKEAPKNQKEKPWKSGGTPELLYKFKLTETGQSIRDPSKKGSDKVGTIKIDTAQQELISLAIFKAVLSSSNPWNNFEDMYNNNPP